MSATTGASVYLKREDLQTVRSYKLRGAYNLLVQLSEDEMAAGVVCSSAGNHAQGFALRLPDAGRPRSRLRAGQDAEAKA